METIIKSICNILLHGAKEKMLQRKRMQEKIYLKKNELSNKYELNETERCMNSEKKPQMNTKLATEIRVFVGFVICS